MTGARRHAEPRRAAGRPRLSLCLIARDEEAMLPDCLASVEGLVDEIVLVDTGSTDSTREVAARRGARVLDRPWDDDFAAPRNLALSHATGDWVLQLDADERLAPGAREGIRRALASGADLGLLRLHHASRADAPAAEVVAGRLRCGNGIRVPRLFRRLPGIAYQGIVHETVEEWLAARGARAFEVDADIVHLGATEEIRATQRKGDRNVRLLERRCREEPGSVVPFAFLASELLDGGRHAEAAAVAERGWALLDAQPPYRSIHLLAVTRAMLAHVRGDAPVVLETVARAEARQGPTSDLSYLRGCALETQSLRLAGPASLERLAAAGEAYRLALRPPRGKETRAFVPGAGGWASHVRLGTVLLRAGRPGEALEPFRSAADDAPDPLEARLGEAEAVLDLGRPAEALRALDPLRTGRPDGWLLSGAAALALGREDEARDLLRGARERIGARLVAAHRVDRLRALLGVPSPDFPRLVAALVERREPAAGDLGAPVDLDLLRRFAADGLSRGRPELLVPLLEPAAEAACPGLPGWTRGVLAELGAEVVDDGGAAPAPGARGSSPA